MAERGSKTSTSPVVWVSFGIFSARSKRSKRFLILLTWRIWWAPNNASKWQVGFNSAFKGLNLNFLRRFSKNIKKSNLVKIRPLREELFHAEGRTDGQTDMTKLIFSFRHFAKAPKMALCGGHACLWPRISTEFVQEFSIQYTIISNACQTLPIVSYIDSKTRTLYLAIIVQEISINSKERELKFVVILYISLSSSTSENWRRTCVRSTKW